MKHESVLIAAILFILACMSTTYAQEALPATGGDAAGQGGTVSWTIGQVGYISNSSEFGFVTAGVQQSFEIIVVGNEEPGAEISIELYPNPIHSAFILQFDASTFSHDGSVISCIVYDLLGAKVHEQGIVQSSTTVHLDDLVDGTYIVQITRDQHTVKTIKVFKTH